MTDDIRQMNSVGRTAQASAARPANTTPYSAGDVIGAADVGNAANAGSAVLEFANIGNPGGHIIVTDTDLRIDVSAAPTGMTSFRLHLYSASPPSALLDNAAWDLPAGDRASYLGYLDLGTPIDMGSTLYVQTGYQNKKLLMGASTSLFGYLVTNSAYPPSSAAVKAVGLNAIGC